VTVADVRAEAARALTEVVALAAWEIRGDTRPHGPELPHEVSHLPD
jgi:hypothetical protein